MNSFKAAVDCGGDGCPRDHERIPDTAFPIRCPITDRARPLETWPLHPHRVGSGEAAKLPLRRSVRGITDRAVIQSNAEVAAQISAAKARVSFGP